MYEYEIRKNGEVIETICAHRLTVRGGTAVFYDLDEVSAVIALEPGMRIDRIYSQTGPQYSVDEVVKRALSSLEREPDKPQKPRRGFGLVPLA